MNPPATFWRPTEGFVSQRYHPSHRNVGFISDIDSPCSTASPAMDFFDDDVLELVPGMLELRLLVSGLRTGAILSLWQEKLQEESRGRVFRPIRARKHQRAEKKDRRERKKGSVPTPQPPTPYKMKDFYLPGYQPPDFPGALGTTPPRETDPEVEDEMSPEGSPEQHDAGYRPNTTNTTTNLPKDSTETQFRSSRDRTKKFMDCFVTESRTLWAKMGSNLNELLESSTECVFLSSGLEISIDRGFKSVVKFLQGEVSNSLEDICSLILVSLALMFVSKAQKTIENYSILSDCDLQFWRDALNEGERTAFDGIIKSIYGPIGSYPQKQVALSSEVQSLSKESLESTSLYPLLIRCLRGMEHLGEAFLNLSSRNAEEGHSAAFPPVNSMYQKFLDNSRPDFVETMLQAIREDLSGKLLFLEALSRPAKELLTIGALPTLRAFEGYVLGVARVYIADLADYKTFVRGFMKFCVGCSSKVSEVFMKKQNEEPYSSQYCKSKVDLELNWFKTHLTKAPPTGIGSSTASAIMKELGFDSEDTTRPKYASYMKKDYKDVGNMLALPELLWSENGSIQVEVDDEEEDDAEALNSIKPIHELSVETAPKLPAEHLPELNPPPPPLPAPTPPPPPPAGVTQTSNPSDSEMIDYTPVIPLASVSDEQSMEVTETEPQPNTTKSAPPQTTKEAPAPPQEPRTSSKRKSWGTDLVSDLVTKKRKGLQTTCEICGISLSLNPAGTSKSNLIRHAATHDGSTRYVCTVKGCNKAFGRKDNLTRHMRKVHES